MAIRTCDGFLINDAGNGTGLDVKKIDGEEFDNKVLLRQKITFLREERNHLQHEETRPSAFKAVKSNAGTEYKVAAGKVFINPLHNKISPP